MKKPIITYLIIAICVVMFLITCLFNGNVIDISASLLARLGGNLGYYTKNGEYYRLFTCMFLHAGILHLALNMYSLFIIGPRVEDFFGKGKFLLIYFLSGISGSLLSIGLNGNVMSVGASGAIFGLFGALIYFGYSYHHLVLFIKILK